MGTNDTATDQLEPYSSPSALGRRLRRGADGSVELTLEGERTLGEMAAPDAARAALIRMHTGP
jgi:hypothetical protein